MTASAGALAAEADTSRGPPTGPHTDGEAAGKPRGTCQPSQSHDDHDDDHDDSDDPRDELRAQGGHRPNPNPNATLDQPSPSASNPKLRARVQKMLRAFREDHTIERVKRHYASSLPAYTVFEMATGGCLDSMAAALAGFRHLGGTEDVSTALGAVKASLFSDLTGARCYGDTRAWREWVPLITEGIDYLKAGQPCTDYASLGKQLGRHGKKGGDLFLLQVQIILALKPKVLRLEMVPNALNVNDAYEVKAVLSELSTLYHVHSGLIPCWQHGDASARIRLFIVGLRSDIFDDDAWEWPDAICDESFHPIARDIAVPDSDVSKQYWRDDRPYTYTKIKSPKPAWSYTAHRLCW